MNGKFLEKFKFTIKNNYNFNYTIYVNVIYIKR